MKRRQQAPLHVLVSCGLSCSMRAGMLATLLCFPLDTLRTRVLAAGPGARLMPTLRLLLRQDGIRGLYRRVLVCSSARAVHDNATRNFALALLPAMLQLHCWDQLQYEQQQESLLTRAVQGDMQSGSQAAGLHDDCWWHLKEQLAHHSLMPGGRASLRVLLVSGP